MNYYEHHIGDYDQATAHLTACEDGIYSRLIRWYMASEAPLPADVKTIQRRVRAHSRDEKAAVQAVLAEFFQLQDDGYHQHRCDEEIERYQEDEPEREAKRVAIRDRQRRTRERRRELFDIARQHGQVPAYNTPMNELQALVSRLTSQATASDSHAPVTRDATATHTHSPYTSNTPHTPQGVRFAEFWTAWPATARKVGRAACEKTWKTRKLDGLADAILAHVAAMKLTDQWQRGYEPAPQTYLNQRRWEDGAPQGGDAPAQSDWTAGAI